MEDRLAANDAVERIHELRERKQMILGVDGFRTVSGGYEAALDLILDLSTGRLSVSDAAREAENFVRAKAAEDITFEIVS